MVFDIVYDNADKRSVKPFLPEDFIIFYETKHWLIGSTNLSWEGLIDLMKGKGTVAVNEQKEYKEKEKACGRGINVAASA